MAWFLVGCRFLCPLILPGGISGDDNDELTPGFLLAESLHQFRKPAPENFFELFGDFSGQHSIAIAEHIMKMWRAVNFNWPVKGYFHWTLVDNFEWERGWSQRFGLWGLDVATQARIRRPSVDFYAEICKENGMSSAMVSKYCPEVKPKLFPD